MWGKLTKWWTVGGSPTCSGSKKNGESGDARENSTAMIYVSQYLILLLLLLLSLLLLLLLQVATALLVAGSTLTIWISLFASTSSYSSVVQSARLLAYAVNLRLVPINAHATWCPCCSIDRAMAAKTKTNVITALTTLPQGWVSTCKRQYTPAITTMWTESSWAFPASYTTGSCARAMADNGETKGLITPPSRWVSAQLLYICVTAW